MEDNYDISNLKQKKKINSRTKGSGFERQICKIFNKRFNTSEFCRSPGSGAFATTHSLPEHLKIYGDIITPEKFKYCIECKKGYNNQNLYSLYNYSSDIWGFINQCEKDSKKCYKIPMVIFKQDRQPTLAIVPDHVQFGDQYKSIQIFKKLDGFIIRYNIYLLESILESYDSLWME